MLQRSNPQPCPLRSTPSPCEYKAAALHPLQQLLPDSSQTALSVLESLSSAQRAPGQAEGARSKKGQAGFSLSLSGLRTDPPGQGRPILHAPPQDKMERIRTHSQMDRRHPRSWVDRTWLLLYGWECSKTFSSSYGQLWKQ